MTTTNDIVATYQRDLEELRIQPLVAKMVSLEETNMQLEKEIDANKRTFIWSWDEDSERYELRSEQGNYLLAWVAKNERGFVDITVVGWGIGSDEVESYAEGIKIANVQMYNYCVARDIDTIVPPEILK